MGFDDIFESQTNVLGCADMRLSRKRTIKALRIVWTGITLWFEYGVFWNAVRTCDWPDSRLDVSLTTAKPTHVLVIGDPQILDRHSYPGRLPILKYITQVLVDINMRKSWREATRLRPDAVIFVGDMMDSGRLPMPDAEYEAYYNRFKAIFTSDQDVPEYFIPGNHDIGLRIPTSESQKARERYASHFGPFNSHVTMAGYNLVMLDALGLAEEDYLRERSGMPFGDLQPVSGGTVKFVETVADSIKPPVILFSHIPLYRPDDTDCGPSREIGTIREGFGESYQNLLSQAATEFLLRELKPSLIFSGDDHDYCEYNHTVKLIGNVVVQAREVTVKSLSMAMNVRRPGFQLLSLLPRQYWKPDATIVHADELCLLPDQISIYLTIYLPLIVFSLFLVLLVNVNNQRTHSVSKGPDAAGTSFQRRVIMLKQRSTSGRDKHDDGHITNGDHDSERLPSPASTAPPRPFTHWSWSFTLLGRRRRISIPERFQPLGGFISHSLPLISDFLGVRNLRHRGSVRNSIHDVGIIAIFPVSIIVLISLWTKNF